MTDFNYWKNLPKFKELPTTYAKLLAYYPPRPIRNETELARVSELVDAMAGHDLSQDQDDYLDLISTLVSQYEDEHHPFRVPDLSPIEALKHLIEESGTTPSDLGRLLGSRELGSKILRGERGLSMQHVVILADHFKVSPVLFLPKLNGPKPRRRPAKQVKTPAWRSSARSRVG